MTLRVGVLGPGAIGGLIGARLAQAGAEVTVLARDRTAAEIAVTGLVLKSPSEQLVMIQTRAAAWLSQSVDVLFVAVKSTQLLAALDRVPEPLTRGTLVVPLLNGVDHVPVLRALRPQATVLAATITVEATRTGPGVIEQLSGFADISVAVGADLDDTSASTARDVVTLLKTGGFGVSTDDDEALVLWRKLSFLAPYALLTTATGSALGQAREARPEWIEPLVREAVAAAAIAGARIEPEPIVRRLRQLPAAGKSSMLKDFEAQHEMELDAVAGPILRALPAGSAPATRAALTDILAATQYAGRR